ncbi:MAG: hypothetical protein FWF50_05470, partial [Defluviitaleaceae bacterium]|nr:hypothetical protein [Defluviitaleaceae bacterium]
MINFILGRAGTGKTFKAINEAIQKRNENETVIFIVPEQYTLQAERNIIAHSKKRVTDIRVLSFKRLAYEVTENKPVHDDISKTMVLFKILKDIELSFYTNVNLDTGFLQSLSHTISELFHANIEPVMLKNLDIIDEQTKLKTEDIAKILEAYKLETENFVTTDNALTTLYKNIPEIVKGAYIYIDSFNSFSEQENKIILRLTQFAKEVNICLTTDCIKKPTEGELFYETKSTLAKLAPINNYIILTENKRHLNELAQLEKSFFEKVSIKKHENIKLIACENFYDEVYKTAYEIKKLTTDYDSKTEIQRFRDIAILAPDEYETAIKVIFKEHGIPFFMDKTREAASYPLIIFLNSLMEVIFTKYNKSMFILLKTGLLNFTDEEVDLLENYSLAYGIKGYKWKMPFANKKMEYIRQKLLRELKPFEIIFEKPEKINLICKQFFEALLLRRKKLEKLAEVPENMTIYKQIISIFENMVNFLGENIVSAKEFYSIMKTGIECASIGKIPDALDSVLVGNIERTRLGTMKSLFVLGNNSTSVGGLSLFSEYEKDLLHSYGVAIKGAKHKIFSSEFSFYSAYTKPTEKLTITYSKKDLHGKSKPVPLMISSLKNTIKETRQAGTNIENLNKADEEDYFLDDIAIRSYYFHNFS